MLNRFSKSARTASSSSNETAAPAASTTGLNEPEERAPIASVQERLIDEVQDFGADPDLERALQASLLRSDDNFDEDRDMAWAIESSYRAKAEDDDLARALELSNAPASSSVSYNYDADSDNDSNDELERALEMSKREAERLATRAAPPASSTMVMPVAPAASSSATPVAVPQAPVDPKAALRALRAGFLASIDRKPATEQNEQDQAAAAKPKQKF